MAASDGTGEGRGSADLSTGWWQCDAVDPADRPVYFALVWSSARPDGTRVRLPVDEASATVGADAVCTARFDPLGRTSRLEVGRRIAPHAPPMWFVEVRESTARPPAVNLVAFTGHGVAEGTLLDESGYHGTDVTAADQLGAVRWYPATGEVDQIYVAPQWRRSSIAGALIAAAATLSYTRDWPRLWSDGQRTELGEKLRNVSPWRTRTADLTNVAPPMTPPT